jgi:nitrite reductase/ring-hydroxylating ferredoxin subunit
MIESLGMMSVMVVSLAIFTKICNYDLCFMSTIIGGGGMMLLYSLWKKLCDSGQIILNRPVDMKSMPSRVDHDRRRMLTYPHNSVANTWYHICDSDELKDGRVIEVRALGLTLAVWRDAEGKPVCHDAYCLHLGANLAVGGKVVDGCIECPFHHWRFGSDGSIRLIPYVKNPTQCPQSPKLKVYPCVDWCGLVCMYFHADGPETPPEFQLPDWVPDQMKRENWAPFSKLDIGHVTLTPIDWVDQAGDHAHFHTLHNEFLIPYTLIPFPDWVKKLFPLAICHELVTYKGDDPAWEEKSKEMGLGSIDKHLIFFTDKAGLTWDGKVMESTLSETLENYVGPAMIAFHIPFTIGTSPSSSPPPSHPPQAL